MSIGFLLESEGRGNELTQFAGQSELTIHFHKDS